jgi:hypothetical protein
MKPIFALALLAILGFAVAGCGSVKKTDSGQYTVTLRREVPSGPITVTGSCDHGDPERKDRHPHPLQGLDGERHASASSWNRDSLVLVIACRPRSGTEVGQSPLA